MFSISRRALLASASNFLASAATNSSFATDEIAVGRGRINLGLAGVNDFSLFYPFINIWKSAGEIRVTADGVTYSTSHNPGAANSAWSSISTATVNW